MIKIVCAGKIKDKHLSFLIDDYVKKIFSYHKITIVECKDSPFRGDVNRVLDEEGERLLAQIDERDYVILLDLRGKSIDSLSLANKIDRLFNNHSSLCFVIGGSYGLSDSLRKRANESIKFSDLTFTHQLTRLLLVEQLYRSFKILNNESYHK